VVVAVVGTVLVLTVPRLDLPGVGTDLDAVARQLIGTHRRLKAEAERQQRRSTLHIDLDRQRVWISDATMDPDRLSEAAEEGYDLPRGVRIESLRTPDDRILGSGTYGVVYFPDGHSFMVDLALRDGDDRELTLRIEPFLPTARVLDDDDKAFSI
jgi:hypothetical protein